MDTCGVLVDVENVRPCRRSTRNFQVRQLSAPSDRVNNLTAYKYGFTVLIKIRVS